MVAEKKGIIRFYSLATQQAFLSLDCGHVPLVSADWCFSNSVRIAAMAGTDWFIFDTSRSRHDADIFNVTILMYSGSSLLIIVICFCLYS